MVLAVLVNFMYIYNLLTNQIKSRLRTTNKNYYTILLQWGQIIPLAVKLALVQINATLTNKIHVQHVTRCLQLYRHIVYLTRVTGACMGFS